MKPRWRCCGEPLRKMSEKRDAQAFLFLRCGPAAEDGGCGIAREDRKIYKFSVVLF